MVWILAGLAFLLALAFFNGMRRKSWLRPSTRAFTREARRTQGYGLFDWLHGYVYARWPYLYISIGTGEHPLARANQGEFGRLRLLDLHNHVSLPEKRSGAVDNLGAVLSVCIIGQARADTRSGFHEDAMPRMRQFLNSDGNHPDTILVLLDLFGDTDDQPNAPG